MRLLKNEKLLGIKIYLEKRKTRILAGKFFYSFSEKAYIFEYEENYLFSKNIIPLGPEFPLTQYRFKSKKAFPSLLDRIPERKNPAYKDYCRAMGITESEKDIILLLATIGSRGPSSFIFEPWYEPEFTSDDLRKYRQQLNLTTREFAQCFDVSQSALVKVENKQLVGNEILKKIAIFKKFPEVALYQFQLFGGVLHTSKQRSVLQFLKAQINMS